MATPGAENEIILPSEGIVQEAQNLSTRALAYAMEYGNYLRDSRRPYRLPIERTINNFPIYYIPSTDKPWVLPNGGTVQFDVPKGRAKTLNDSDNRIGFEPGTVCNMEIFGNRPTTEGKVEQIPMYSLVYAAAKGNGPRTIFITTYTDDGRKASEFELKGREEYHVTSIKDFTEIRTDMLTIKNTLLTINDILFEALPVRLNPDFY